MKLEETRVPLAKLFLDPNNPRFFDTGLRSPIAVSIASEQTVQDRAMGRILDDRFEVESLKDSIARLGYLPVDRMVVTRLPGDAGYLVVEGNRRLSALRLLAAEDAAHETNITDE